jgi:2,3-bisphosphoglycerate-independent phosphoglycerate mutase
MSAARRVLPGHAVNEVRLDLGENPANGLWLWGGGDCIAPGSLRLCARASGALVGQSRLVRGLARACGVPFVSLCMPRDEAPTEAAFKVASIVKVLQEVDHLTIYVEAPGELGQYGSGSDKVRALERMDHFLLGPLLSVMEAHRPFRIVLMPDGVISSDQEHPTSGNVPVVCAGDGVKGDESHRWDEQACSLGDLGLLKPRQVLDLMLEDV